MTRYETTFTLAVDGHKYEVIEWISAKSAGHVPANLDAKYGETLVGISEVWEGE